MHLNLADKFVDNRKCIFLVEKSDHKDMIKIIDTIIRPVFEVAERNIQITGKLIGHLIK